MKVLVVDDEPSARALLKRVLQMAGYEVLTACSGLEAVDVWQREQPPVVVTDWLMPGMDGEALCRHIRAAAAERYTFLILVTSRESQEAVVAGLAAGADDYVTKPFNADELVLRVKAGQRVAELEAALTANIEELRAALSRVHTLEGLLPMCAYCKSIRDDEGYWRQVEVYIEERSDASFTHGFCPDCYEKHVAPQLEKLRERKRVAAVATHR